MKVFKRLITSCMLLALLSSIVTGQNYKKSLTKSERDAAFRKQGALFTKTINTNCVDTVTCGTELFVAKCTTCDPRYFYCSKPGGTPLETECPSGKLFNPDPLYPSCIQTDKCPYHPPGTKSSTPKTPHPTAVTTDAGCVDTIICRSQVFVAKCTTCDPRYFYCKQPGASPLEEICGAGKVFNPDPNYPRCISSNICPYHPPYTLPSTASIPTTTTATTTTTVPSTTTRTTTTTTVPSTTTKTTTTTSTTTTANTSPISTTTNEQSSAITSSKSTDSTTITSSDASQDSTTTAELDVTVTPECQDSLTCTEIGDFPKCVTCKAEYFHCEAEGTSADVRVCGGNLVFNTDHGYPECISPFNCPFIPDVLT